MHMTIVGKLVIGLALALLCSGKAWSHSDLASCVEKALFAKVTRIDIQNKRFFIVGNNLSAEDVRLNISQIRQCFHTSLWAEQWSLSVFNDSKYAGYKDEELMRPFVKDNSWANAYVAEYDERTQVLMAYPALNSKVILLSE